MRSKLAAARLVTQAGGSVIIASGTKPEPLTRILAGEPVGHPVPGARRDPSRAEALDRPDRPAARPLRRRRRCAPALESGSKSLLAIGIVEVVGEFEKGDVVGIRDPDGQEFARGLTNYATADARRIRGLRTQRGTPGSGLGPLRRGRPSRQSRPSF